MAIEYPIYFLGKPIGVDAPTSAKAAYRVWDWLSRNHDVRDAIDPLYKPVPPKIKRVADRWAERAKYPTVNRLVKNTRFVQDHWEVGLGIPDRRRRKKNEER